VKTVPAKAAPTVRLSLPAAGSYYYVLRPYVKGGGKTWVGPPGKPLRLGS
jgi:hypothetical protein